MSDTPSYDDINFDTLQFDEEEARQAGMRAAAAMPDKEDLDPELLERAVEILRGIVRGNGLPPAAVKAENIEGEIVNFEGLSYFTVEAQAGEKRVHGKVNGQVLGSAHEMRQKMQVAVAKAAHNPDVRRHAIQVFKKRPDLGVLVDNQYISLDKQKQSFVVHEGCPSCGRDGKLTCPPCGGKGRVPCRQCHGSKEMNCPQCRGTRSIATPQGAQNCPRCHARGRIACTACRNAGMVNCPQCKGKGYGACQNCNGTGWHSLIGTIALRARSRFLYDREKLPEDVCARIDKMGPRVVIEKHMHAVINEDEERAAELAQIAKEDQFILPYHLRLPVGVIGFAGCGTAEPVTAKLFGFVPLLYDMKPFLEEKLAPSFAALSAAAAGKKAQLKIALRARFIGEAVMVVIRHRKVKALALLGKRYPVGIGAEKMQHAVNDADRLLHAIIDGPRRNGMIAGSVAAALLYAGYYLGPVHGAVLAATGNAGGLAVDFIVFAAGVAAAAMIAQYKARAGVRRALGKFVQKIPPAQLVPPATRPLLIGVLVTALLYVAAIELAHGSGKNPPPWYGQARARIIGQ